MRAGSSANLPAHEPLVVSIRGDTVESVHFGSIAVVDRDGAIVHRRGDPSSLHFTRSALKPLQALPLVEDGGLSKLGFGSQELALMCASHSGERMHVDVVRRILAAIDASEADLQCGCHDPMYFATHAVPAPQAAWSALFHNCSGKHSGFLCYCRLRRQPRTTYLDPEAPLQMRIRNTVQRFAGPDAIAAGTDGCGAPNYALPLTRLAQAYARLASDDDAALRALFFAMTRHPDLALMQVGSRGGRADWVAKIGADGVQAIGIRSRGLGIAIKIADGSARALAIATQDVLRQLGLLDEAAERELASAALEFGRTTIKNHAGRLVGRLAPVFRLGA